MKEAPIAESAAVKTRYPSVAAKRGGSRTCETCGKESNVTTRRRRAAREERERFVDLDHIREMIRVAIECDASDPGYKALLAHRCPDNDPLNLVACRLLGDDEAMRRMKPRLAERVEEALSLEILQNRWQVITTKKVPRDLGKIATDLVRIQAVQKTMRWPSKVEELKPEHAAEGLPLQLAWMTDSVARARIATRLPVNVCAPIRDEVFYALLSLYAEGFVARPHDEELALVAINLARNYHCYHFLGELFRDLGVDEFQLPTGILQQAAALGSTGACRGLGFRQTELAVPELSGEGGQRAWVHHCLTTQAIAEGKVVLVRGCARSREDLFDPNFDACSLYFPDHICGGKPYAEVVEWRKTLPAPEFREPIGSGC